MHSRPGHLLGTVWVSFWHEDPCPTGGLSSYSASLRKQTWQSGNRLLGTWLPGLEYQLFLGLTGRTAAQLLEALGLRDIITFPLKEESHSPPPPPQPAGSLPAKSISSQGHTPRVQLLYHRIDSCSQPPPTWCFLLCTKILYNFGNLSVFKLIICFYSELPTTQSDVCVPRPSWEGWQNENLKFKSHWDQ